MALKQTLSEIKQLVFHALKLYPIYDVLSKINAEKPLKGCNALEVFAYTGAWQARAYKQYLAYHEAWEIDPAFRSELEKNLPKATVKITNSFEEVLRCKTKFDFINVDNHQGIFGDYCENFEFFPLLFNVAKDDIIVNLNVIPHASDHWREKYGSLFNEEHLARREAFYKTGNPANVSLEEMLKAYGAVAAEHGYKITWHYYRQRTLTYYLALHISKNK